ncbi:LysE family translocator [Alkalicoccobacillus porphyridii]|uniref:LysE family translocator n=1 Tax=Alkalicoccobacillus porphyridii TaxID=2597270 RepID=A0A554A248_9BACI|nr:LysE family translocator [Alkalicoccobacillus porphyridii]TSB47774.1 LysE family translocator [Alkalicoccobacillus porphyridii]
MIWTFLIYCFIVTVTPGPTNIIILSTVQNVGVRPAMVFTYGSICGFGILLMSSAMLNVFFAQTVPHVMIYIQVIGTMYLLYLAYQVYNMSVPDQTQSHPISSFGQGVLLQIVNPKAVLFTLTLFPSFVLPYNDSIFILSVTVITVTLIGFISFLIWVSFGAVFKELLRKYHRITNLMMAIFLMYAATMIWF